MDKMRFRLEATAHAASVSDATRRHVDDVVALMGPMLKTYGEALDHLIRAMPQFRFIVTPHQRCIEIASESTGLVLYVIHVG